MENYNNIEQHVVDSPVVNFYNGKSIFITGGTGFLGTVLVEKLLYTCVGIKNIYILIKQKHGLSIEERVLRFLNSQFEALLSLESNIQKRYFPTMRKFRSEAKTYDETNKNKKNAILMSLSGSLTNDDKFHHQKSRLKITNQNIPITMIFKHFFHTFTLWNEHCHVFANTMAVSKAFRRLKERSPDFVNKIKPIGGNILEKNLGLNEKDITVLRNEVSVVFHSAANVSFDMSMADAINTNTRSTGELIEICKTMPKLTAFVYVSSAYSNCNRSVIDEKVYEMEVSLETLCDMLPHSKSDQLNQYLLDGRPNTYTYSKALSEHLIKRNSNSLPCVIVRPSIILSSVRDPEPGFLRGRTGPCSVLLATMAGDMKCWHASPSMVVDVIPVDITANLMIVSAWDVQLRRSKGDRNVKVFNCCSGVQNPITLGNVFHTCLDQIKKNSKILRNTNPNTVFLMFENIYIYYIIFFLLNIIPAIFIDLTSWLLGREKRLYKGWQRINKLLSMLKYFNNNQFLFIDNNVRNLYNSLDDHDKNVFDFDVTNIQWESFLTDYVMGLNKM